METEKIHVFLLSKDENFNQKLSEHLQNHQSPFSGKQLELTKCIDVQDCFRQLSMTGSNILIFKYEEQLATAIRESSDESIVDLHVITVAPPEKKHVEYTMSGIKEYGVHEEDPFPKIESIISMIVKDTRVDKKWAKANYMMASAIAAVIVIMVIVFSRLI